MDRVDEVLAVIEGDNFICNAAHYARDLMLMEIAISLAVIADKMTDKDEVTE